MAVNINVDGTLSVAGISTLTGNTSVGGTLTVTGATSVGGNMTVSGNITEGSTLLTDKYAGISHTHTQSEISDLGNSGIAATYFQGGAFRGTDTRSTNTTPSSYQNNTNKIGSLYEFKGYNVIGAPNRNEKDFVLLETFVPWGDSSGGLPSQLAIGNGLAYRTAASDSTWNSWRSILDSTGGTITGNLTINGTLYIS